MSFKKRISTNLLMVFGWIVVALLFECFLFVTGLPWLIEKLFDLNKKQWMNLLFLISFGGVISIVGCWNFIGEPFKSMLHIIVWIFVISTLVYSIILYWMDVQNVNSEQKKR